MKIKINVWRQTGPTARGAFRAYALEVSLSMSFLDVLDVLNERLISEGDEPIAFDHDCREGICGSCGVVINGVPHGPQERTTACQLHMRQFSGGDELWVEPWRASAFPIVKDLVVDRSAFDRIIEAGGYIDVRTGSAPEANTFPIAKDRADSAFDAATCIGCGACVAACPNASGMLFTAAKVTHLSMVPQGQQQRYERVVAMIDAHDHEGFGNCTNHGACQTVCPKGISVDTIAGLNRDYLKAALQ